MSPALSAVTWKRLPFPTIFLTFAILVLLCHIRGTSFAALPSSAHSKGVHSIYKRILEANSTYYSMLNRQSKTLGQARREYVKRYHLNPPEGFDQWFAYAKEQKSLIIDDFDVIHEKLAPFRDYFKLGCGMQQLDSHILRAQRLLQICIKDAKVSYNSDEEVKWMRSAFKEMISPFLKDLPDVCFLMNLLDEPRILLPNDMIPQPLDTFCHKPSFVSFDKQKWWSEAVLPCSPTNPARLYPGKVDILKEGRLIDDFKSTSDICQYSSPLRHGIFLSPSSLMVSHDLVPIASNAALSTFSDILFPSIWRYYFHDEYNQSEDISWDKKANDGYWRVLPLVVKQSLPTGKNSNVIALWIS